MWHRRIASSVVNNHNQYQRSTISVYGEDVLRFLQNVVTNDTQRLATCDAGSVADTSSKTNILPNGRPQRTMYCHMLNSKGRSLFDVFLYGVADNQVIVDVASEKMAKLKSILAMYSLRQRIEISESSYRVWTGVQPEPGVDIVCEPDPRLPGLLGYRGLVSFDDDSASTSHQVTWEDPVEYIKRRLELGVAEGPEEIPEGSVPLEYNIDALNGIRFDKGCYIGQELMARTHYQGQIRKRIVPFHIEGEGKVGVDDDIIDSGSGQKVGVVKGSVDGVGIGMMRLSKVFSNGLDASPVELKTSSGVDIASYIPSWWPESYHDAT
jgi:folate-binding protein YgfZ